MIETLARAKINLGLEVTGRRPDGYHDVVTILQEIDLADRLTFRPSDNLRLRVDVPQLADEANLVLRAAQLLREISQCDRGVEITLEKRIPVAAGLGGGSSDAAATLLALNQLWGLRLSESDLEALAGRLGSDVGFFIRGGTQLATGRGEVLEALPTPRLWAVLVFNPVDLPDKTRRLYQALRPEDWSSGNEVRTLAASLGAGRSITQRALPSAFARTIAALAPGVSRADAALRAVGAIPALSGAGPTLLSLQDAPDRAREIADRLADHGFTTTVVAAVGPGALPSSS